MESSSSQEWQSSQSGKQDRRENALTSVLHPYPHPSEYDDTRRKQLRRTVLA